jgi:hypothetical protein
MSGKAKEDSKDNSQKHLHCNIRAITLTSRERGPPSLLGFAQLNLVIFDHHYTLYDEGQEDWSHMCQ